MTDAGEETPSSFSPRVRLFFGMPLLAVMLFDWSEVWLVRRSVVEGDGAVVPKPPEMAAELLTGVRTALRGAVAAKLPKLAGVLVFCWAVLKIAGGLVVEGLELAEGMPC